MRAPPHSIGDAIDSAHTFCIHEGMENMVCGQMHCIPWHRHGYLPPVGICAYATGYKQISVAQAQLLYRRHNVA